MSKRETMTLEAAASQEAYALTDQELDAVAAGSAFMPRACATGVHLQKQPATGGPVPIPYPVMVG